MRLGPYEIFADYHTHTRHSHGRGSVLENVQAARRRGLRAVAIADHGPASLFGVGVPGLSAFDAIRQEVIAARKEYSDIEVLVGAEANVVSEDGELDVPLDLQQRLDVVLVGLHPLVRWKSLARGASLLAVNAAARWMQNARCAQERNTRALVNAVLHNRVHVVTHPGYRLPVDTRALARACAAAGCALEINSRHDHTTVEYIRLAKAQGARFALGSDAHSPERVGALERAAALAAEAGLTGDDIVNAR